MDWMRLTELPLFWEPFKSCAFAALVGIVMPACARARCSDFFTFRNRIRGVYFTILTQALVIITTTLFVGQQQLYTGGTNGLTGYRTSSAIPLGGRPDEDDRCTHDGLALLG